jgi:hypothetical protein
MRLMKNAYLICMISIKVITMQVSVSTQQQPNPYPYVSGLRQMGMDISIQGDKLAITPADKVTSKILEIARAHKATIIQELIALNKAAAIDTASDIIATSLNESKWADKPGFPPHDLEVVESVLIAMFRECAGLGFKAYQYWDGEPEPKPAQRPYCYLRVELVNGTWNYWPVFAHVDGNDYVWAEVLGQVDEVRSKVQRAFEEAG